MSDHSLFIFTDDEKFQGLKNSFNALIKNIKEIGCFSFQKISPLFIYSHEQKSDIIHPVIRLDNPADLSIILDKKPQQDNNLDNNYDTIINTDSKVENNNLMKERSFQESAKLQKVDNNEGERRNLDKINLFRGFYYAFDHHGSVEIDINEEDEECSLNFHTANKNLSDFFDIDI